MRGPPRQLPPLAAHGASGWEMRMASTLARFRLRKPHSNLHVQQQERRSCRPCVRDCGLQQQQQQLPSSPLPLLVASCTRLGNNVSKYSVAILMRTMIAHSQAADSGEFREGQREGLQQPHSCAWWRDGAALAAPPGAAHYTALPLCQRRSVSPNIVLHLTRAQPAWGDLHNRAPGRLHPTFPVAPASADTCERPHCLNKIVWRPSRAGVPGAEAGGAVAAGSGRRSRFRCPLPAICRLPPCVHHPPRCSMSSRQGAKRKAAGGSAAGAEDAAREQLAWVIQCSRQAERGGG